MSLSVGGSSSAASYLQQAKQLGAAKIGDPIDPLKEWLPSSPTADASVTGATAPSGSVPPFGAATMNKLISEQATSSSEEDPIGKPAHPHGHHHVADSDAASSTNSSSTSSASSIGEDPIDPGIATDSDATVAASTTTSNNQSIASLMEQLGKMQSQVVGVVAPIVSAII